MSDSVDQGAKLQQALSAPRPETTIEDWINDVGPGWQPLIRGLDANLRELDPNYRIGQIKEKFGGLRYYVDAFEGDTELADKLVRAAEDVSFKLCEDCGAPGEPSAWNGFWVETLCSRCTADRRDEQEVKKALANGELELVSGDD